MFVAARRDPALVEAAARWADPVAVPTLAMMGADDGSIAPAVSATQQELFSGKRRREVIPGAGHWPHREAADVVTALVGWWMGG